MKKVVRTKHPSMRQLSNMCYNLGVLSETVTKASVEFHFYSQKASVDISFWIHPGNGECYYLHSWEDLQDIYFKEIENV